MLTEVPVLGDHGPGPGKDPSSMPCILTWSDQKVANPGGIFFFFKLGQNFSHSRELRKEGLFGGKGQGFSVQAPLGKGQALLC